MSKQKGQEEQDLFDKIAELESRIQLLTTLFDDMESKVKKMQEFKQPVGVAGLDMQAQFEKCLEIAMLNHLRANPNLMRKSSENANYIRRDAKAIIDFTTVLHEEICNSFASKNTKK